MSPFWPSALLQISPECPIKNRWKHGVEFGRPLFCYLVGCLQLGLHHIQVVHYMLLLRDAWNRNWDRLEFRGTDPDISGCCRAEGLNSIPPVWAVHGVTDGIG